MPRLARSLTVVLGVLIALSGAALVIVRTRAAGRQTATSTGPSAPTSVGAATGTGAPGDKGNGSAPVSTSTTVAPGPAAPASPGTTVVTPATLPLSPLARLSAALEATLAGTNSCLSVEDPAGRVLYRHQPDRALIPASTEKLLVAQAALATLGSDHRFTTTVVAPAAPVNGQVAALWLVGDGDPLLALPEFVASTVGQARVAGYPWTPFAGLADALAAAGVRSVAGGVRGDDSFEDRLRFLPVWPPAYQEQKQIGLLSALSVNEGIQFTPPTSTLSLDPPGYAASELARLLQSRGVAAAAAPDQNAPAGTVVLASVTSAPVSQIVEAMLRASDNWIAELLVRAIDKGAGGAGTTAGGLAVVRRSAAQAGIPMSGVQMDDGSGLSRTDRATCGALLAALDLGNQPAYGPLLAGLPVAGQTGTLAYRYTGTPLVGKVRAKTGSLDNAGGMVGVVAVAAPTRFAFLDNNVETETALYAKEDAIVGTLAAYSGGG